MSWVPPTRRGRAVAALLLAVALRAFMPVAGFAAEPVSVRVRQADLGEGGSGKLVVQVSGAHSVPSFTVTEQGKPVEGLRAEPLSEAAQPVAVVLAMDVSGSTAGKPLADAKSAALQFVASLPENVRIELIAFGARATVAVPFTTDRARVRRSISALVARGETALYDGIVLAATTVARAQALPNIVVFTDGRDTVSRSNFATAIATAKKTKAPVTTIGLQTKDLDPGALRSLATETGGRALSAGASSGLASAFASAAHDLASQYVLSYEIARPGGEVAITVTAAVDGASASDQIRALAPKGTPVAIPTSLPAAATPKPLLPIFGTETGLMIGVGCALVALILLFAILFWRPQRSEFATVMSRALKVYTRGSGRKRSQGEEQSAVRKFTSMIDRVPKPARYEEKLQHRIDRAGWPFRASEFLAIQAGAGVAGGIIGFGLFGRWWLALVLMVAGPFVPKLLLERKISKRQAAFLEQLPDTLQLLAGSLQAGYGFMQAIDTLVKESPPPSSMEFNRVLTETRLGMPVEEALNAMGDRIGSEDFRWVVLAINIQRQVGGNLSQLLRTVADTLRERERVRRQVKVLSAEGKLSAYILGGLPFGIAGYIAMVNPGFLQTMTGDPLGRMMIGASLGLLGIGIAWMRKLIRIEV